MTAKNLKIQWRGQLYWSGLLLSPRLRNPLINLAIFVIWFWISSHRGCEEHCAFGLQSPSEDYENALSSTLTTRVARFSAVGVNQWSLINLCDTPDWSAALPTIFMEYKSSWTSAHIGPTGSASQVVIIWLSGVIIIVAFFTYNSIPIPIKFLLKLLDKNWSKAIFFKNFLCSLTWNPSPNSVSHSIIMSHMLFHFCTSGVG